MHYRDADALAEALKVEFGEDIGIALNEDSCGTGNFEVVLDGKVRFIVFQKLAALRCRASCSELPVLSCRPQLIHSKATMGHGRCQTAEEVQRIVDIAQSVIDSK